MVNSQPKDDRRPGRPTREQAASIGKSVLVGARPVFCELGYAAASMDQIAAAVGVSKLTIYRRFPSKEALLIAVVDHYLEQLTVTADAKSEDGQSALDTLPETTRALFEASLEPEAILFGRLLVTEATKNQALRRLGIYRPRAGPHPNNCGTTPGPGGRRRSGCPDGDIMRSYRRPDEKAEAWAGRSCTDRSLIIF